MYMCVLSHPSQCATKLTDHSFVLQVSLMPGSDVKVPRRKLNSLRTANSSVYVGDLAVLVYGREILSCSSLTGRPSGAHKDVGSKPQLDTSKLDAILGECI